MQKMRLRLARDLAMVVAMLAFCVPAHAHPHVWVTVESTLLSERGAFTGLLHKWTFDEFYSAMAVEGLDTNKDGKYDREELAELAKVNVTSLKDFGYFTFPMLAGKALKVADPRDYWLEYKDGILSLHFTVPFAVRCCRRPRGSPLQSTTPAFSSPSTLPRPTSRSGSVKVPPKAVR